MTYNPPQPMWKRSTAGILDFFLAFVVCVFLSSRFISDIAHQPFVGEPVLSMGLNGENIEIRGVPALFAIALMVSYFTILSRTGGTVFQRLFGMKRFQIRLSVPCRITLAVSPFPTSQRPDTLCGLLFLQLVPLLTKPIDFIEHPLQESLSGHGRYPLPFKLTHFLSVTDDLDAHVLDFGTNVF